MTFLVSALFDLKTDRAQCKAWSTSMQSHSEREEELRIAMDNQDPRQTIDDFIVENPMEQKELEKELETCRLEDVLSPVYLFQNVNATFIGW